MVCLKNDYSSTVQKAIENSALKCPRCGNIGRPGAVYCEKCGVRIQMNPRENQDTDITRELPKIYPD